MVGFCPLHCTIEGGFRAREEEAEEAKAASTARSGHALVVREWRDGALILLRPADVVNCCLKDSPPLLLLLA